jgi:hypothetical protein
MLQIDPAIFLISLLVITAFVWTLHRVMRHGHKKKLRELAAKWQMRYTPSDVFDLSARVASEFPIPGVADLKIRDMIYASQGDRHRYVFTAEYTLGVIERHRREARAATFCDPKDGAAAGAHCGGHVGSSPIILGPGEKSLIEQYEQLGKMWGDAGEEVKPKEEKV